LGVSAQAGDFSRERHTRGDLDCGNKMTMKADPKRPELGSDESIVLRVLSGERELYEVLVRRHNQRLYRAARAILRNDNECEDVMQEAYVQAFAHLAQFRAEARFSTWLTRIAVHEALARRRRAIRHSGQTEVEEPVVFITPEQEAGGRELVKLLERAIDALPDNFREVLILRTVEDMSVADTAAVLDVPEDTVKTRLFRARNQLREAIADGALAKSTEAYEFHAPRCNRIAAAVMERVLGK
jgi:RNA polymerase sigma-70 factor (ECF subfamily)